MCLSFSFTFIYTLEMVKMNSRYFPALVSLAVVYKGNKSDVEGKNKNQWVLVQHKVFCGRDWHAKLVPSLYRSLGMLGPKPPSDGITISVAV